MELKDFKMSLYETKSHLDNKIFDLDNYVGAVMHGLNQDAVIKGREAKQKGDKELYDKIKSASKAVTGNGTVESGKNKLASNTVHNGLICIDVDYGINEKKENALYNDPYSLVVHKSFGGDGICVFIRINTDKIKEAYTAISKYYFDNYDIRTDPQCSNINRLRFISYDPDVHVNTKAKLFNVKIEKKDREPAKPLLNYVFTKSDFEYILEQIRDKHVDLCPEYYSYFRVGLGFAREFGESGRNDFHFVCSFGSKYNSEDTDKDYTAWLRYEGNETSIATFYYYCKNEGLDIYTQKTRDIINRVNVSKAQGSATVENIVENLKVANNVIATDEDKELIKTLIDSKVDYTKLANTNLTDIEQLAQFIVDAYTPTIDEITHTKYVNGKRMEDSHVDDIYIACRKNFDFNVAKGDINSILNSSYVKRSNILKDFIRDNTELNPDGYIDQYASFLYPQNDYNKWAFKKWIVGAMHNWFCDFDDTEVCPLTLVLTGQSHGIGKSSFFRNLMPKELRKYMIESKLSMKDKDSMIRMGKALGIIDPEFGGKAFKDDKEFKDASDQTHITLRVAYGREDSSFRRRAILGGCSNELDILKDVTGNRRILPILVDKTDYEAMVNFDKTSLIMEAYNLYKSGFEWRVYSEEDKAYIYENTSKNQAVLPIEEIFFMYYSTEQNNIHTSEIVVNQGEVLRFLNVTSGMKPTKYDVAEIFKKNKFEYKTHRLTNGTVKNGVKLYMDYSHVQPDKVPF